MSDLDMSVVEQIPVELSVEVGRVMIPFGELSKISKGAVIELNSKQGDLMGIFCNGTLVARGEIVTVNDNFGIRVIEVLDSDELLENSDVLESDIEEDNQTD